MSGVYLHALRIFLFYRPVTKPLKAFDTEDTVDRQAHFCTGGHCKVIYVHSKRCQVLPIESELSATLSLASSRGQTVKAYDHIVRLARK
jgi:hypothetical protein